MEDSDGHDSSSSTWTLLDQFKIVYNETLQSQPQQYGALSINSEVIEDFQGYDQFGRGKHHKSHRRQQDSKFAVKYTPCGNPADSRDVKLKTLINRRNVAKNNMYRAELDSQIEEELMNRAWWDLVFDHAIFSLVGGVEKDRMKTTRHQPKNFDCLKAAVQGVEDNCGRLDDYSLKYVYTLANMCEERIAATQIADAFQAACRIL